MDPLSRDNNAICEDIKCESFAETFNIHENTCYGEVTHTANENKHEEKHYYNCHSKVIIIVFVIVLLLGIAGACIAFALQIVALKSELQMESSLQSTFTDTIRHLEEVVHQLNLSDNMLYQQLSHQNDFLTAHELNSSNKMLYQQLNLQNELNVNLTGELNSGIDKLREANSSINQLDEVITNRLNSIFNRLELLELLFTLQPQCGDGFWEQVANINMNDSSHQCPSAWQEYSQSATPPRYCALPQGSRAGCVQTSFPVNIRYNKVCGRITGRSIHSTDAFRLFGLRNDENYVDGISITHSSTRAHIWTFAADQAAHFRCPCSNRNPRNTPSFVDNNYFCDASDNGRLWDGDGCVTGVECCLFNSPPWFTVQLPEVTMDDIDVRICIDENSGNENVGIELLELYVQI